MLEKYDIKPKPQGLDFPVENKAFLKLLDEPKPACAFDDVQNPCSIARSEEICNSFEVCFDKFKKKSAILK